MNPIPLNPNLLDHVARQDEKEVLAAYFDLLESSKDDARVLRKHLCYNSLPCFYSLYLADPREFVPYAPMHFEMLEVLPRGAQGEHINVLAPRGAAKSTLMSIALPLWKVCYKGWDELRDIPADNHIVIVSFKASTAEDRVGDIKRHLESNPKIHADFGNLCGETRWGVRRLETANGVTLSPYSRTGAVRGALSGGYRPSLVIADDLDDAEHALNEEWRIKTMDWFNTDLLRLGNIDGTTNFIVVDTMKHRDGISARLKKTPDWKTLEYRAIETPENLYHPNPEAESRWKDWENLYSDMTLEDADREAGAHTFYERHKSVMTEGVVESWGDQITYLGVRKEICKVGYFAVMRELQNIAVSSETAIFDMENAIRCEVRNDGIRRSDGRLVSWNDIVGMVSYLDYAGFTEKERRERCFASVVTVAFEKMKAGGYGNDPLRGEVYGYLLGETLLRGSGDAQFNALCEQFKQWKSKLMPKCRYAKFEVGVESPVDTIGAIRESFSQHYRTVSQKMGLDEELHFIPRTKHKETRISALEAPISQGWLAFGEVSADAWTQMTEFPGAQFNDFPDALEGALSMSSLVKRGAEDPLAVEARKQANQYARKNAGQMVVDKYLR